MPTDSQPEAAKPDAIATIPNNPEGMPNQITVDNLPEAMAKLDRREQMMVLALASGMTQTDIATLCNMDHSTVSTYISRHGLRELVSLATPQHVTAFRAARWAQIEQRAMTRAGKTIDDLSGMQAITTAAIATDKLTILQGQLANSGDGRQSDDILISIKARIHR